MTFWMLVGAVFVGSVASSLFMEALNFAITYHLTKKQLKRYDALQTQLSEAYPNGLPPELLQLGVNYPLGNYPAPRPEAETDKSHGQYL